MRSGFFICIFFMIQLFLFSCERDKSVLEFAPEPTEYENGFSVSSTAFEFSNYQLTNQLVISYTGTQKLTWKINDLPDWLSVSKPSGVLQKSTETLLLTADTVKAVDRQRSKFYIITKLGDSVIRCKYYHITPLPPEIIDAGNRFIISRVGPDFFNNSINFNRNKSRYYPPNQMCLQDPDNCSAFLLHSHYLMVYDIKIPQIPQCDEFIEFVLDSIGNIIEERDVFGLPDCVNNPGECLFPVDEAQAISIATNAGLEEGIKPWIIDFYWYGWDLRTFVWSVKNTLYEKSEGNEYYANGKIVVIDANSGEVLRIDSWLVIS